jgi:ribose transport system ATP-binding protein
VSLLAVQGIRKRFGATVALDGVDLGVSGGEVCALVGENGSGKSTLLNVLSGALEPDGGAILLAGEPFAPRGPADARRLGVAHIHQELSLCPHLSVAENILLGVEPSSRGFLRLRQMRRAASRVLEEFGRGDIDPSARTGSLSLASRQVVEICRALARDSRVLLFDEPTSSLPRPDVERLFRLIRQLQTRGIAIVYVSHFLEEIREIAGAYAVLRDGRRVGSGPIASVRDDELISLMVGRPLERGAVARRASTGDILLEVRDLAAPGVASASFGLRRGEVLGIAGLVGSGRTEMLRAIFGLDRMAAGSLRLRGRPLPLRARPGAGRVAEGLGYLSEDRKAEGLALSLSVADNVTLSRLGASSRAGWIDLRRQRRQAGAVAARLRVRARSVETPVRLLSGGNQQKVALGRLLHQDADVLLLDEPSRGIDVASKQDIHREIANLAAEGKAVLIVSSYLPELLEICDRIAVMHRGRLSAARPAAEWTPDSLLRAAVGAGG